MAVIRVGTSSWADRELTASGWYPRADNTPAGRLAYYAAHFDLVEVDTSYYAIPDPTVTAAWAERTPPGFTFNVKAFSLLTGHPTSVSSLPRQVRPETSPDRMNRTARVNRRDLGDDRYEEVWRTFHEALDPLAAAGKLGVVLLQFPPWLEYSPAALRRILHEAARCRPHRPAVELRNASWFTADRAGETLAALHAEDITFVSVDMPQGHPSSVPPLLAATNSLAVLRLHGRSDAWATGDKKEKFRYAYSDQELTDWAARLTTVDADEIHVLFNNCCGGQAQHDAARFALSLTTTSS